MDHMNKLLLFLIFIPSILLAQAGDYTILSKDKKCWVKHYNQKNKSFKTVNPKKFHKRRIFSTVHHKDERVSVFKYQNQLFVALTKCLQPVDISIDDFDSMIDSAPTEDDKYVTRETKSHSFVEGLRFDEQKYFLEANVGTASISDQSQVVDDYGTFDGIEDELGNPITFGKPEKSKYKVGGAYSFGGGWRWGENSFLAFRVKYFSGKKEDSVPFTSAMGSGDLPFEFKDSFTSFLIGNKWIFLDSSHLKPTLALYAGLNSGKSELTIADQAKLEFDSTGFEALAELGFEYAFNENIAIGFLAGYTFMPGGRKWKLKTVEGTEIEEDVGFKSKLSYSHFKFLSGLRVYFR